MPVTLFTKPLCPQCTATHRALRKHGIDYETVDLTEDPKAMEFVKGLGYSSAPVVHVSDDHHWSGFRDERIKQLAEQLV